MFRGRHALITGGASGLGRLHAERLLAVGARVTILDVNEAALAALEGPSVLALRCDVTDLAAVRAAVARAEETFGVVERLVHCAAIMPGGLLMERSAESLVRLMSINYGGMVHVCQTVVPGMLARDRGDVVLYGSTAGIVVAPRFGGYGATKAANNFYAQVLIAENRGSKVRFQLVCPPAVDTPLLDQAREEGPRFLKDIRTTRLALVSPELVVDSVEDCLERGVTINFPGSAKWVALAARVLPSALLRAVMSLP